MHRELEEWLSIKKLPIEIACSFIGPRLHSHHQLLETLSLADREQYRNLTDRLFHFTLDECHGMCVLKRQELAKLVADSILHRNGDAYDLDCFVIMPNHVHVIVQFRSEHGKSLVGQSWMRYSARRINPLINAKGAFWQPEPFDHIIRNAEQFRSLQDYIANNPMKAKLSPGEFLIWKRNDSSD